MKRFIVTVTVFVSVLLGVLFFGTEAYASENEFYEYLDSQIEQRSEMVEITSYMSENNWSAEDLQRELISYYMSSPELFYVERSINVLTDSTKTLYYVEFSYIYSPDETEKMMKKLDTAAKKAIEGIDEAMSDAEKVLYVHDYIILNCEYDDDLERFSAYDCLVNKSAVCMGYTLAYQLILEDYLGIECAAVVSDSENHSWNYVRIGNNWYHSDITADDSSVYVNDEESYRVPGWVSHKNVLLSDSKCKETSELHSNWYVAGGYPAAKSKTYDNRKWRESLSAMEYKDGKWYFVIGESEGKKLYSKIYSYDFSTRKVKLIKKASSKWYIRRTSGSGKTIAYGKKSYTISFMRLAVVGDCLYFNTSSYVYRYNLETGKTSKIYTLKKKKGQQIYSVAENGNKLRVCYKYDITYKDNYFNIKLKNA